MTVLISRMATYKEVISKRMIFEDEIGMTHSLDPFFVDKSMRDNLTPDHKVWMEYRSDKLWYATPRTH